MLSQEQNVLPALTHSGGHSTTTVSAAVHRDNRPGGWRRKVDKLYIKTMLRK